MTVSNLRRTGALVLLAGAHGLLHAELEIHPNHFGAAVDFGQVMDGIKPRQ